GGGVARRGSPRRSGGGGGEARPPAGGDDAPGHGEVRGQDEHVRLRVRSDEGPSRGRRARAVVTEAAVPSWFGDLDGPMHHVPREHGFAVRRAEPNVAVTRPVARARLASR